MYCVKFSGAVGVSLTDTAAESAVEYLADAGSGNASSYPLLYVLANVDMSIGGYVGAITSAIPEGYSVTIDLLFDGTAAYPTPPNSALPSTLLTGPMAAGTPFSGGTGVNVPLGTTIDVRVTTAKAEGVSPANSLPAVSLTLFTSM